MDYLEVMIAKYLYVVRDHIKNGNPGRPDVAEQKLIQQIDRASPDLAYELLERFNRKKDDAYHIFNTYISASTRKEIRQILLKTYISNLDRQEIDNLIMLIRRSKKTTNEEIKFLLFNGNEPFKLEFIAYLASERLGELGEDTRWRIRMSEEILLGKGLAPGLRLTDRETMNRLTSAKKAYETDARSISDKKKSLERDIPVSEEVRERAKAVSISSFRLGADDREKLEKTFILICELNHAEFIAALIQFRVDGLEERISNLEKANQTSFYSWLAEFSFAFVMPFAIGKAIKYAANTLPEKTHAAYKAWWQGRNLYRGYGVEAIFLDKESLWDSGYIGGLQKKVRNLGEMSRFMKRHAFVAEHLDDFAQAGADAGIKVAQYIRNRPQKITTSAKSIPEFIAESISDHRQEILRLNDTISGMSDKDLEDEIGNKVNNNYTRYYESMKTKSEEFRQKEHSRRRQELIERTKTPGRGSIHTRDVYPARRPNEHIPPGAPHR